MIAVIPVRQGELPLGGLEAAAESSGAVVLVGSEPAQTVAAFAGIAHTAFIAEAEGFNPAHLAACLLAAVPRLASERVVLLPHCPDGRDLAPHLATALGRPLISGAIEVSESTASVARLGGLVLQDVDIAEPVVATLQPGVRSVRPAINLEPPETVVVSLDPPTEQPNPLLIAQLEPDPATVELGEARRIIGVGAGLGSIGAMAEVGQIGMKLGASVGATRVATDWNWVLFERQIGTTGVAVNPDLYIALGISGAVQHTAGLGSPEHIISVNTDPHCPMMAMADLALVCDAAEFAACLLAELEGTTEEAE